MSKIICRLCLNDGKLFNVFDSRLTNSEQLIKCILLGTGVEICRDDAVTKYVCQYCSDLAIFLYRYRKKALANDKALKELINQPFTEPLSETTAIVDSNRRLFESLETHVEKIIVTPGTNRERSRKRSALSLNCAVHPTVIDLIKTYPRLKIPNDLLQCDIQPRVVLSSEEIASWVPPITPEADVIRKQPMSDIERFKMMCPGIHITKIRDSTGTNRKLKIDKPNTQQNKRKSIEFPIDTIRKRRKASPVIMSTTPVERCSSSMTVSAPKATAWKKRRSQTPAPRLEKQVPKLKISLRKSADQSEINGIIKSIPTTVNEPKKSVQNLDGDSIQQEAPVQHTRENSRELLVIRRNKETSEELPTFHVTKGSFMESLSMRRRKSSQQDSPVSQRNREGSVESPAIQHNIEATTEATTPHISNRREVIAREGDGDDRGFDAEDLLDTFTEEIVINCGVCNKMFTTQQQLRTHERVHRCCAICNMIFRSLDALLYHQREVCFKKLIANPPKLELVRVDAQPEMAKLYLQAMTRERESLIPNNEVSDVLCISDDEDDVAVGDQTNQIPSVHSQEMDDEDFRHSPSEFQFICRIFGKYSNLFQPNTKIKTTETKPRIFVRYNSKSQIVLENMFAELLSYRVPVELVAKPNSFAYISFTKTVPEENNIYCWANEPVIGLREKTSYLSILLNSQSGTSDPKRTPQTIFITPPDSTSKTINNFKTVQIPTKTMHTPINLPQTSVTNYAAQPTINQTQPPIIMTQTLGNVTSSEIVMTSVPVIMSKAPVNTTQQSTKSMPAPLKLIQPSNDMMQPTFAVSQPILKAAIPRNPRRTYTHQMPSTSSSAYFTSVATTPPSLVLAQPVPSTSTSNENNFGLRVKSLSELS